MEVTGKGWAMTFTDRTRKWSVHVLVSDEPHSGYNLAEFIQEDPASSDPAGSFAPYASTTPVEFSAATVNGRIPSGGLDHQTWMGLPGPNALVPSTLRRGAFVITADRLSDPAYQYLSDVLPRNEALNKYDQMEETWTETTSPSVMTLAAARSIAASKRLDMELQTQPWPSRALADIKGLATADGLEINDLDQLGHLGRETLAEWRLIIGEFFCKSRPGTTPRQVYLNSLSVHKVAVGGHHKSGWSRLSRS
jgi:hypothetical protein